VSSRASLLDVLHGLLARTYRMRVEHVQPGRFIVGDAGFQRFYADDGVPFSAGSVDGTGARTLIRESGDSVRAAMYLPDALIRRLEEHPPWHGVHDDNVDAFATLVEELDHLLYVADRAASRRPLTMFELELHANVSKHLVLSRFLAGGGRRLSEAQRVWLRFHLFEKLRYSDDDPAVRRRYRDAARWCVRFLERLAGREPAERIEALRRFHDASAGDKLRLIESLGEA
jgi:hypothetical protein